MEHEQLKVFGCNPTKTLPGFVTRCSVMGEKANVPSPDPHTAMPVAKDRFFSKYDVTLTMAGR